jgi:hypothetical protein
MHALDVEDAVVRHGTEAVEFLGRLSAVRAETLIPEQCLGLWIASSLKDELRLKDEGRWDVRLEGSYTDTLNLAGLNDSVALRHDHGGQHADIIIYEQGLPKAIIELKKVEYSKDIRRVREDQTKLENLIKKSPIPAYIGLLIFDDDGGTQVIARVEQLRQQLGIELKSGEPRWNRTKEWQWCFACVAVKQSPAL